MDDDYFSLTSILADNHKLSCTFMLDVPDLGYLEGGTEKDLQKNTKVELPFWMAHPLSTNELTTFTIPVPYGPRVNSALIASAPNVKLANLVGGNGWWYRWGRRIADIMDDQSNANLRSMLMKAFVGRLPTLQDLAAHHASADHTLPEASSKGDAFREGMEGDERELFTIGQDSGRMIKAWFDGKRGGR
ncbi:hypothetical protein IAT38_005422 [Cryptococcus sp. DSM 104549]